MLSFVPAWFQVINLNAKKKKKPNQSMQQNKCQDLNNGFSQKKGCYRKQSTGDITFILTILKFLLRQEYCDKKGIRHRILPLYFPIIL